MFDFKAWWLYGVHTEAKTSGGVSKKTEKRIKKSSNIEPRKSTSLYS